MPRSYRLKKRAERQEETRGRIVEAAVALHSTVGPGRTTVSAIAEKAGVERHTYYERNEAMLTLAVRDAEVHPLTREMFELYVAGELSAVGGALAKLLPGARRRTAQAMLQLALDFNTWRLLVRRSGLSTRQAA